MWKFDVRTLAGDLDVLGFDRVEVCQSTIFVAQLATGVRSLSVGEFVALCAITEREPARYIVEVA